MASPKPPATASTPLPSLSTRQKSPRSRVSWRRGSTRRVTLRRRDGALAAAKLELRAAPRGDGGRYWIGLLEAANADKSLQPIGDPRRGPPAGRGAAPRMRSCPP